MLARAEVAAERLQKEIGEVQASLDHQKSTICTMRDKVKRGDYRLTGHVVGTAEEVKARLANRLDKYKAHRERPEGEAGSAQVEAADDRDGP